MYHQYKNEIQIFSVLLFAILFLSALSLIIGANANLPLARAQAPEEASLYPVHVSPETLDFFGLAEPDLQLANSTTFNLTLLKQTTVTTVSSGNLVTFTIIITNQGPDLAPGVFFYDQAPAEMINISYDLGLTATYNMTDDLWLFSYPLPVNSPVLVTVTGELTSAPSVTVTNTAGVFPHNPSMESDSTDNSSEVKVGIGGYDPDAPVAGPIYFPIIRRDPTPTPTPTPSNIYEDDFSDDDSDWFEGDDGDCDSDYHDNKYRLKIDEGETCFRPAPDDAETRYGIFEVEARRTGGSDEFIYGIYINGEGGDEYYMFIVEHDGNSCNWGLIRRKNGDSDTERSGGCTSESNGYRSTNTLKISHTNDGKLVVYLNGDQLGTYTDGSQLTGKGTGVYGEEVSEDDDVTLVFDDFVIRNP